MPPRKYNHNFTCEICGKEFYPKNVCRPSRFCSQKCKHTSQRTLKVAIVCEQCGDTFWVKASLANQRFCSRQCWRTRVLPPKPKWTTCICEWCNKEFGGWPSQANRFCSNQCRSEFAARRPKPSARRPNNYVVLECEWCNKQYRIHKCIIESPDRTSRFCSAKCRDNLRSVEMRAEKHPRWKGGTLAWHLYGPNWTRQSRRAKKRDNRSCQICGYRTGGDRILDVHHIISLREFDNDWESANRLSNLICLCRPCHQGVEASNLECPTPEASA